MDDRAVSFEQLTDREKEILEKLSSGLSDKQIADKLFLSLNTVKWHNRQIYAKLGASSRTQAIAYNKALRPPGNRGHALPAQITPFIGRRREIEAVKKLLGTARLLTLTGTGGTGKTRLALRVAEEVAKEFAEGVYFIDLAPLSTHTLVASAIAGGLGVVEIPSGEPRGIYCCARTASIGGTPAWRIGSCA